MVSETIILSSAAKWSKWYQIIETKAARIWKYVNHGGAEGLSAEAPAGPDLPTPAEGKMELIQYEMWQYTQRQAEHKEYKEWDERDKCKVTEHLPVYSCCVSPARSLLLVGSTSAREHVFA
jgi:hypothetical protein